MTIEELKEKEKQLRVVKNNAEVDKKFDEINADLRLGKDYVDVIGWELQCSYCPFEEECKQLTTFECSETKCHYFVKKYVDKPIVKMPSDAFISKYVQNLTRELTEHAKTVNTKSMSEFVDCYLCPINETCELTKYDNNDCYKELKKHIDFGDAQ